jgi:hypothetical protein
METRMSSREPLVGPGLEWRKPRAELRHWSTYTSVTLWWDDHRGYVPVQMAAAIDRVMRTEGLSFPDAYRLLLRAGKIIHIDPADDIEPPAAGETR